MSKEVYAITDVDGYIFQMRETAAKSLSDNNTDNLDEFISLGQVRNLVNEYCLGLDEYDRPLLDEKTNEKIFEETSVWIHGVALAKLAAKDHIECCWDDKSNEMIFWSKEIANEKPKKRKRKTL
jgi:hypothetical protein